MHKLLSFFLQILIEKFYTYLKIVFFQNIFISYITHKTVIDIFFTADNLTKMKIIPIKIKLSIYLCLYFFIIFIFLFPIYQKFFIKFLKV